jgi:hypothetical protein
MAGLQLRWLGDATLVASPSLRLFAGTRLPTRVRRALGSLRRGRDFDGVLVRKQSDAATCIALSQEGTRLWSALAKPRALAEVLASPLDPTLNSDIARLVLEGAFAVEAGNGSLVTGREAFETLFFCASMAPPAGRTGRLTVLALERAGQLPANAPGAMANLLYRYNTVPPSEHWRRQYGKPDDLERWLAARSLLTAFSHGSDRWTMRRPAAEDHWIYWRRLMGRADNSSPLAAFKLYVSPTCADAIGAFHATLEVTAKSSAVALKIGRDLHGILRPDKLVIYFNTAESLFAAVPPLRQKLAGAAAQGVPLTPSITDDGLLSWGLDPPNLDTSSPGVSWRTWLAGRFARALSALDSARSQSISTWGFALGYVSLDGVNPLTLAPPGSGDSPAIGLR